jgi:hypothetical protein
MAFVTLLSIWEVWNEHNDRVFYNKSAPSFLVLDRIKRVARLWVLAGAKSLVHLISGESLV